MASPASAARRARRRSWGRCDRTILHTPDRRCTRTSRCRRPNRWSAGCRSARTLAASRAPSALLSLADVEDGEERLLRNLHGAHLLHPLLARLLLLQQLSLACDVAAVALREHVLPLRLHGLACDDPRADSSLDRDVEHLARDLLPESVDEQPTAVVGEVAMDNERQRV